MLTCTEVILHSAFHSLPVDRTHAALNCDVPKCGCVVTEALSLCGGGDSHSNVD